MPREYEVDAAVMRDALSGVQGVTSAVLEVDATGAGVLRVQLVDGADQAHVVSEALAVVRRSHGVAEGNRLRLVGPSGEPVVAVVQAQTEVVAAHGAVVVEPPRAEAPQPVGRPPSAPPPVVWQPLPQVPASPDLEPPPAPAVPDDVPDEVPDAVPNRDEAVDEGPALDLTVVREPAPEPTPDPAGTDDRACRLVLERVEVASERVQMWATVHLARGESRFTGSAGATAGGGGPHRAVAAATARAAESALGGGVRLDVEAVDVVGVGQDQIGVVIVTLLTERGLDRLTGAALVRGDGRETIVRATLDALNRRADSLGLERPATRA